MIVVNNSKYWIVSLAVSLIIFLVIYFTVIKSTNNTVNNAIKQGQALSQQAESNSAKLQACIAAAGTDATKAAACAQKFTP